MTLPSRSQQWVWLRWRYTSWGCSPWSWSCRHRWWLQPFHWPQIWRSRLWFKKLGQQYWRWVPGGIWRCPSEELDQRYRWWIPDGICRCVSKDLDRWCQFHWARCGLQSSWLWNNSADGSVKWNESFGYELGLLCFFFYFFKSSLIFIECMLSVYFISLCRHERFAVCRGCSSILWL